MAAGLVLAIVIVAAFNRVVKETPLSIPKRIVAGNQALAAQGFGSIHFRLGRRGDLEIAGLVTDSAERQRLGDRRANPAGRVPGDVWEGPRLTGNNRERTGHPCQMPESILERIIRAASNVGDLVFDPFAGSGTTLAVAKRLGRRWLGCEISPAYAAAATQRIGKVRPEV